MKIFIIIIILTFFLLLSYNIKENLILPLQWNVFKTPIDVYNEKNDKELLKSCIVKDFTPLTCAYTYGNYIFPINYKKCENICPELVEKQRKIFEGFEDINTEKVPNYWCYTANFYDEDRKCISRKYDMLNPANNTCGKLIASNSEKKMYKTKDECIADNFTCENLNEKDCAKNYGCGWSTDSWGNGKCMRGFEYGPFDVTQNSWPSTGKKNNNFKAGHQDYFDILTPSPNYSDTRESTS